MENQQKQAYTRRALELRAAEYYASIRKPEKEWKSIEDLAPQLVEFEHQLRAQNYVMACEVLNLIEPMLYIWGYYAQLVVIHERLLKRLTTPHLQMQNIGGLGCAYQALGKTKAALTCYQQALELALVVRDSYSESRWRGELGCAYYDTGHFPKAISSFKEAMEIARIIEDRVLEARHLGNLGRAYGNSGQYDNAIQVYEQALHITDDLGDSRNTGVYKGRLGVTYRRLGRIDRAIKLYQDALPLLEENGARAEYERHLGDLGSAYRDLGKFEEAAKFHQKTLTITREIGYRRDEAIWLSSLGFDYYGLGLLKQALEYYQQVYYIVCEIDDRRNLSVCLCRLGEVYRAWGEWEKAIDYYTQALSAARKIEYQPGIFDCHLGLSRTALYLGHLSDARKHSLQALTLHIPKTYYLATLTYGIVQIYQQDINAKQAFTETLNLCQTIIKHVEKLYLPHYTLTAALVGQTICNPHWADPTQRPALLDPALTAYRRALAITAAPGIVHDALGDLELIRAAGIEGLEPAFALLEDALPKNMNTEPPSHKPVTMLLEDI